MKVIEEGSSLRQSSEAFSLNNMMQSDPMTLSNSDHPGMSLTSVLFDGGNFLGWRRQIRMALGAKLKLGFVDGTCLKPDIGSDDFEHWMRCDYMVNCWILNSMVPDLVNAFLYTNSAQELWLEIAERYGQSNAPLIFQVRQEIGRIAQVNVPVAAYFSKLKRCWDELDNLCGLSSCSCGKLELCSCAILSRVLELENQNRLMQFLMNLNSDYNQVQNQILVTDPLPNVNRAYYLLQQVERQKQIAHIAPEPTAFMTTAGSNASVTAGSSSGRKEYEKARTGGKRVCDHCKDEGHTIDQCFEIICYPNWYKGKKGKRGNKMVAQVNLDSQGDLEIPLVAEASSTAAHMNPEFVQDLLSKKVVVTGTTSDGLYKLRSATAGLQGNKTIAVPVVLAAKSGIPVVRRVGFGLGAVYPSLQAQESEDCTNCSGINPSCFLQLVSTILSLAGLIASMEAINPFFMVS